MPRMAALAALAAAAVGIAIASTTTTGCKRSKHARVSTYTPPPIPAGFADQTGAGWRIAVPATWKEQKTPAAWAVADPQAVDDFHANVNVVTEITNLITAQRAYEMNSKVITASDDMLSTLTNLH